MSGNLPTKYGLMWYSTYILGSTSTSESAESMADGQDGEYMAWFPPQTFRMGHGSTGHPLPKKCAHFGHHHSPAAPADAGGTG